MVGALELVPNKAERKFFSERGKVGGLCRNIALGNGLILRATYDSMLLSPPLIINRSQIDELFEKAWKSLNETAQAIA
jgi:putrescine---pyruvate transaminase